MLDVSVIIPHYNNGKDIIRAYQSIMQQTQLPNEIIIVDDCSIDTNRLKKLNKKHDKTSGVKLIIYYFSINQGPSIARNYAVKKCTSEYVAFLDADDVWHKQKLEIIFNAIKKMGGISFIFHKYLSITTLASALYPVDGVKIHSIAKYKFMFKNYIATPSVIIKKSTFVGFPVKISYCEDYCCWLMNNQEDEFLYVNLPLAHGFKKPIGESGLSASITKMHKGFIKALVYLRKNGYISNTFFCIAFICEYLKFPLRFFR